MGYDDGIVVAFSGGEKLAFFDLDAEEVAQAAQPTSFTNNGRQLVFSDGLVSVGHFGGNDWVETYDVSTGELVWGASPNSAEAQSVGYEEAKLLGPITPDGRVLVQATAKKDGVVIALVDE